MTYSYTISGDDFSSAGTASSDIKKKLRQLGLAAPLIKRTAIAMYEAEINMVIHAGGGHTVVDVAEDRITIELRDEGPGIPDIDLAMTEGYSTASDRARQLGFGAGMGLPNIKRNVDYLHIDSEVGRGTTVTLTLKVPEAEADVHSGTRAGSGTRTKLSVQAETSLDTDRGAAR